MTDQAQNTQRDLRERPGHEALSQLKFMEDLLLIYALASHSSETELEGTRELLRENLGLQDELVRSADDYRRYKQDA